MLLWLDLLTSIASTSSDSNAEIRKSTIVNFGEAKSSVDETQIRHYASSLQGLETKCHWHDREASSARMHSDAIMPNESYSFCSDMSYNNWCTQREGSDWCHRVLIVYSSAWMMKMYTLVCVPQAFSKLAPSTFSPNVTNLLYSYLIGFGSLEGTPKSEVWRRRRRQ